MYDRPLTENSEWIICMWDIRGDSPLETALVLKRSLAQVNETLQRCKENGFYDIVKRHIEIFDEIDTELALAGFADALRTFEEVKIGEF